MTAAAVSKKTRPGMTCIAQKKHSNFAPNVTASACGACGMRHFRASVKNLFVCCFQSVLQVIQMHTKAKVPRKTALVTGPPLCCASAPPLCSQNRRCAAVFDSACAEAGTRTKLRIRALAHSDLQLPQHRPCTMIWNRVPDIWNPHKCARWQSYNPKCVEGLPAGAALRLHASI